jgi:hypothetical protein
VDAGVTNTIVVGRQGKVEDRGVGTVILPTILITSLTFNPTNLAGGGSFSAMFAGPNLTGPVFFDIRFRAPGSTIDQEAFNWQKGTSGTHSVPAGTAIGTWTVNGLRAHQNETDHTGSYTNVSVTVTVTQ